MYVCTVHIFVVFFSLWIEFVLQTPAVFNLNKSHFFFLFFDNFRKVFFKNFIIHQPFFYFKEYCNKHELFSFTTIVAYAVCHFLISTVYTIIVIVTYLSFIIQFLTRERPNRCISLSYRRGHPVYPPNNACSVILSEMEGSIS